MTGFTVEAVLQNNEELPLPPGTLVTVNERQMHLNCLGQASGQGQPTVVLESGLGGSSLDWALVQERLASNVRVCSYDRFGYGWSDASPLPRTPLQITGDLHVLLHAAGEPEPYLLVAHSIGGLYAQVYASRYTEETAGLVLVDPRSTYYDRMRSPAEKQWNETLTTLMLRGTELGGHFGLVRLFGANFIGVDAFPPDQQKVIVRLVYKPATIDTALREIAGARDPAANGQLKDALGNLPLIVLTTGQAATDDARWRESHRRLAELSTNGHVVIAEGCGHYIHWQDPDLVVENILAGIRVQENK